MKTNKEIATGIIWLLDCKITRPQLMKLLEVIESAKQDGVVQGMELAALMVRSQSVHSDFHFKMDGAEQMMADKIVAEANRIREES